MAANKEVPQVEVQQRDLGTLTELDPESLEAGYVYRWVHKIPLKVARAKYKGYVIVDPAEEKILNVTGDSPETEDGTYTIGDVVLMRIKKLDYKARRHALKRKADKRLKGPERKFRKDVDATARQRGIEIEVITDKDT